MSYLLMQHKCEIIDNAVTLKQVLQQTLNKQFLNMMHVFSVTSDTPVKLLVMYSPPYGESPNNVIRPE